MKYNNGKLITNQDAKFWISSRIRKLYGLKNYNMMLVLFKSFIVDNFWDDYEKLTKILS